MSNEMIERAVKALELAKGNAPFYVLPQYRNKAFVYETLPPGLMDMAHSKLIGFEEAEILCEKLNNEWIVKEVLKSLKCNTDYCNKAREYTFNGAIDAILSGE